MHLAWSWSPSASVSVMMTVTTGAVALAMAMYCHQQAVSGDADVSTYLSVKGTAQHVCHWVQGLTQASIHQPQKLLAVLQNSTQTASDGTKSC